MEENFKTLVYLTEALSNLICLKFNSEMLRSVADRIHADAKLLNAQVNGDGAITRPNTALVRLREAQNFQPGDTVVVDPATSDYDPEIMESDYSEVVEILPDNNVRIRDKNQATFDVPRGWLLIVYRYRPQS